MTASDEQRRKERVSMAREICLHRGENPNAVDRGGCEGWEKYEPLAGAAIREAERLFALRGAAQAAPNPLPRKSAMETALRYMRIEATRLEENVRTVSGAGEGAEIYRDAAKCIEFALSSVSSTSRGEGE